MCSGKPCHSSEAIEMEVGGVQNILTSYLTCADHKQAYKSWPELSQQTDIWVYLRLTGPYTQSWNLYCVMDIQTSNSSLLIFENDWQLRAEKAEIYIIRRWFVWVKCCLNSDIPWPLSALRPCWLFDVPHTFCLPWWVGKTKPEQGPGVVFWSNNTKTLLVFKFHGRFLAVIFRSIPLKSQDSAPAATNSS